MSIGRFAACDTSSNPEIFDIEMIRDDPDYINPLIQVEGEVSNGSSIIADCIISDFITEYNVFTALKDDQGRQIVAVICVDGEITQLN